MSEFSIDPSPKQGPIERSASKKEGKNQLERNGFQLLKNLDKIESEGNSIVFTDKNDSRVLVDKDIAVNVLNKSLKNGLKNKDLTQLEVARVFKKVVDLEEEGSSSKQLIEKNERKIKSNTKKSNLGKFGAESLPTSLGILAAVGAATAATFGVGAIVSAVCGSIVAGAQGVRHAFKTAEYEELEKIYNMAILSVSRPTITQVAAKLPDSPPKINLKLDNPAITLELEDKDVSLFEDICKLFNNNSIPNDYEDALAELGRSYNNFQTEMIARRDANDTYGLYK
jgi:hypothetical protein